MKGYLYILSSSEGRYYIGSTGNIGRRLKQHKAGHTQTTKRMTDIKLVFNQEFSNLKEARFYERKIKSWKRKDFVDKIVNDGCIRRQNF